MLNIRKSSGELFELFPDTILSIEENSPMFTDNGSFSLPLELPATMTNLSLLAHPELHQRRTKFVKTLPVVISCGIFHKHANMYVDSLHFKETISTTLYFGESNFYSLLKNKLLRDVFADKVRTDFSTVSGSNGWLSYLNRVMCGDVEDDFHIFPVILEKENIIKDELPDGILEIHAKTIRTRFTITNRPHLDFGGSTNTDNTGKRYYRLVNSMNLGDPDDDTMEYWAPDGYGIAPYLKFTYVLRYVFTSFGYELQSSYFDTDASFKKLCILHSTVDALVSSTLNYSQLLPNIEVNDFLSMVENSFGVGFSIDENQKTVTPRFWKDVLISMPVNQINSSKIQDLHLNYSDNRKIKLFANRTTPESETLNYNTIQKASAIHGEYQKSYKNNTSMIPDIVNNNVNVGIYLIRESRTLIALKKDFQNNWYHLSIDKYLQDYYEDDADTHYEERTLNFAITPLMDVPLLGITKKRVSEIVYANYLEKHKDSMEDYYQNKYSEDDGIIGSFPYLGQLQNLNTVLQTKTVTNEVETYTIEEESTQQMPIYLAFAHGYASSTNKYPDLNKTFFSSQDAYNNVGDVKGTFDLIPINLYKHFWEKYDDLLQSSFHEISVLVNLSMDEIMNLKFHQQITVDGQIALPLRIRYELSNKGLEVIEFVLRITKSYD